MSSLLFLSDQDLVNTYNKAIECNLDGEFINLLFREVERRGLDIGLIVG
ncbi:sporulation histidine kinase inhibitor Sda [Cytobacillus sp. FJAT-54145]|uniref:Sporulation histidine kinase inhibitor Sda n=1 Tax=Cytobacillus spartinae TaxID=3299023 RepID=A0ABW6KFM6_9BACI